MVNRNMSGILLVLVMAVCGATEGAAVARRNAYATIMYMGTPKDYEFYVATRVLLRSLTELRVDADLVVIASMDVPFHWLQALEKEDGAKIMRVNNIKNPYTSQTSKWRFKFTLNKLYAWKLTQYERVVMLDSDNLFLRNTDELFQCGQFCAVFINPCIFHTGLFVLQPSMEVFNDMMHELNIGRKRNPDFADQGFLVGYLPDLLDRAMFHPPKNGTKLQGLYRLPLGYQMDATYYYLRLRWNVPCGPNGVITFPGAPLLKPWYWWSWPLLPLGIDWHAQRLRTLGYSEEMSAVLFQAIFYLGSMALVHLSRLNVPKLCYRFQDGKMTIWAFRFISLWSIMISYLVPLWTIPQTVHPFIGWSLYVLGSWSLCFIVATLFVVPILPSLVPGVAMIGALATMAYPWYNDGVTRSLWIFGYGFCCAPILWAAIVRIILSLPLGLSRDQGKARRTWS